MQVPWQLRSYRWHCESCWQSLPVPACGFLPREIRAPTSSNPVCLADMNTSEAPWKQLSRRHACFWQTYNTNISQCPARSRKGFLLLSVIFIHLSNFILSINHKSLQQLLSSCQSPSETGHQTLQTTSSGLIWWQKSFILEPATPEPSWRKDDGGKQSPGLLTSDTYRVGIQSPP